MDYLDLFNCFTTSDNKTIDNKSNILSPRSNYLLIKLSNSQVNGKGLPFPGLAFCFKLNSCDIAVPELPGYLDCSMPISHRMPASLAKLPEHPPAPQAHHFSTHPFHQPR